MKLRRSRSEVGQAGPNSKEHNQGMEKTDLDKYLNFQSSDIKAVCFLSPPALQIYIFSLALNLIRQKSLAGLTTEALFLAE